MVSFQGPCFKIFLAANSSGFASLVPTNKDVWQLFSARHSSLHIARKSRQDPAKPRENHAKFMRKTREIHAKFMRKPRKNHAKFVRKPREKEEIFRREPSGGQFFLCAPLKPISLCLVCVEISDTHQRVIYVHVHTVLLFEAVSYEGCNNLMLLCQC